MPMTMNMWRVDGKRLLPIAKSKVDLERDLEDWIHQDLEMIGLDALVVGRQIHTDFGGFIDLLAINSQGQLIVIELKRNKTPRDVVAQCLDYGSWVHDLTMDAVSKIHEEYGTDLAERSLQKRFSAYFEAPLPDKLDPNYRMVIVAGSLDDSSERIVRHLSDVHRIDINVVFFNVFDVDGTQFVGRSWLTDPEEVEERSVKGKKPTWTGYLFVNTGIADDSFRDWELNVKHGFISAGGGARWIRAIQKLSPGDKIFAFIKGKGYVGYGMVEEEAVLVKDFRCNGGLLVDALPDGNPWKAVKDPMMDEWLARVRWIRTVPEAKAKWFVGAFANQNVVCKIRDENTAKFLKGEFAVEDDAG